LEKNLPVKSNLKVIIYMSLVSLDVLVCLLLMSIVSQLSSMYI